MTEWLTSGTWDLGELEKQRLESAKELVVGNSLLDIACRDGTFSLTLARDNPAMRVVGFDTDASAITWANDEAVRRGIENATYFVYDLLDPQTQVALGQFDCVVIMETLEHLPPQRVEEGLSAARAFVKPGGRLIVSVPANSHISDPDHKTVFYREAIHGKVHWSETCPHLWMMYYIERPLKE